jgi:putative N6-adenine-specific DNA methylase
MYTQEVLIEELASLGYKAIPHERLNVTVKGTIQDIIKLNLSLRTAHRVLMHLFSFRTDNLNDFYGHMKMYSWEELIPTDGYFRINSYCKQHTIRDTQIVSLKAKDAIADRFVQSFGHRPDSGKESNQLVFFIHWINDNCNVYLDSSGESIARHGYRLHGGEAPLSESLAASIILTSRWDRKSTFINPMCGSGTLAIEAALMAANRYPGLFRNNYSFKHLIDFDKDQFNKIKDDVKQKATSNSLPTIIATDKNSSAIRLAQMNAKKAGVDQLIQFKRCDFKNTPIPDDQGILIINPEYGERMGDEESLAPMYQEIGDFFKQKCQGYTGYVFTGNPFLSKKIGLRTKRKSSFMNGKIECRLLEYELYSGSKKKQK